MQRVGRSFAVLLATGLVLELGGLAVASIGVETVGRCYWSFFPRTLRIPDVCNRPIAVVGDHLFVPAAIVGGLVLASIFFGTVYAIRLSRGSARVRSRLGPLVEPPPPTLVAAAQAAGVDGIKLHDHPVQYAACLGVLRPVVVVSTSLVGLLDENELAAVLAHEDRHRRRRAPLRQLLARTAAHAVFFLPVLNDLLDLHLLDEELLADEEACRTIGRRPLVTALAKISGLGVSAPIVASLNPEGSLLQRLTVLSGRCTIRRLRAARIAASVLCGAFLVLVVVWMPVAGYR
jgi:Zn-dependent protease with chaperone function